MVSFPLMRCLLCCLLAIVGVWLLGCESGTTRQSLEGSTSNATAVAPSPSPTKAAPEPKATEPREPETDKAAATKRQPPSEAKPIQNIR